MSKSNKKADVVEFKCVAKCPECGESVTVDADEFECGGCHCMECNKDFELKYDAQGLLEVSIKGSEM